MIKEFEKIIEYEIKFSELASKQFAPQKGITRENVQELLELHSVEIRKIIKVTNDLIDEYVTPFLKDPLSITETDAVHLEEFAEKLSGYRESVDTGLCYDIRHALTVYAQKINDEPLFIRNMFYKGLALFYLDRSTFRIAMGECYQKVMDFSNRYEEFDCETRKLICRAYGNYYISVEGSEINETYRRYDKAKDFWENTAQRLNPEFPICAYFNNMYENLCSTTISVLRSASSKTVNAEYKARLLYSAEYMYDSYLKKTAIQTNDYTSVDLKYIYNLYAARYYNGIITIKELVDFLFNIYIQADDDYTYDDLYKKLHISALYLHYLKLMPSEECSKEQKLEKAKKITGEVFAYTKKIPDSLSRAHVATFVTNFASGSKGYYDDLEYVKLLLSLTVFRHPPTYAHSVMVAKIAFVITKYMLEHCPDYFIGLPDINTVRDVKNSYLSILRFVWYSGLVHDVGKISYTHLVSFYVRRLNDREFEIIKQHSPKASGFINSARAENFHTIEIEGTISMGEQLVDDKIDIFDYFADVAVGHHKSFDGKFGYPPNFDNLKSPVKQIIDIITIADSIDAATDSVGRSYASKKTLEDMREDLLSQIETRYCPVATKIIFENQDLYNEIYEVLNNFRYEVYQSCFVAGDLSKSQMPHIYK